jgi:hypothetical protein
MFTGTGFIAEAAREAEIKARKEERLIAQETINATEQAVKRAVEQVRISTFRNIIIRCWHGNITPDDIVDITGQPRKYVDRVIGDCEKVKKALQTYKKALAEISELNETELDEVFKLLASKE